MSVLTRLLPKWPATHPETGEEFVGGAVTPVKAMPPGKPSTKVATRWKTRYDEFGESYRVETAWRPKAEKQYEREMAEYLAYAERWRKDQGNRTMAGGDRITGSFSTADGSSATGEYVNGEWLWLDVTVKKT